MEWGQTQLFGVSPHQMGWYWATLATEYELLRLSGQSEEAQKTLEDIFLGLQAYRRLDMQAQCMARKRYDEITDDFEVENCETGVEIHVLGIPVTQTVSGACLCSEKYREGGTSGHPNFDNPCEDNCDYQPILTGYSGFFLREDATQALEILHDPSEDKYNIDLVSSDYAMSLKPPCTTTFSQPCFLVHRQHFMSHDGMSGLMIGLALIKRYIPENAEVTTCDGTKHKPLEMAKKIASAIVDRADDAFANRISWPGSPGCCAKETFLSGSEGGHLAATIHGFKHAADYIDDHDRRSNLDELLAWAGLRLQVAATTNTNAKFWLRLKAIGWDMGEENNATKTLFESAVETQNLEILTLINNLLHPGGDNLDTDQAFFEELLCKAPCGGPCYKQVKYGGDTPEEWPEFDCPNEPEWTGQRWETNGPGENRLFNGLDYMALHNIYMLHYNQPVQGYFNPNNPQQDDSFGAEYIDGPEVLCPSDIGHYEIIHVHSGSITSSNSDVVWETSTNLELLNSVDDETDVKANTASNHSYVQVSFEESRGLRQYYGGTTVIDQDGEVNHTPRYLIERCAFNLRKPVIVGIPDYLIETDFDHCNHDYWFRAIGPDLEDATYLWTLQMFSSSGNTSANGLLGKEKHITWPFPGGNNGGGILIALTITTDCGERTIYTFRTYDCQDSGRSLAIAPNPGRDQIFVGITDEYIIAPEGLAVRFINTGTGAIQGTRNIYSNGEMVDISDLPDGTYTVQTMLSDNSVLNASFIIARN